MSRERRRRDKTGGAPRDLPDNRPVPHVLGFLAVAAVITVTPGPDMALVTRSALRGGPRAARRSAIGVGTGLLVWTCASVAGIAVLFTSLIPQFIVPGPSATAETLLLGGLFCAGGVLWICLYALVAGSAAILLRRPRVRRAIDAVSGTVLVGFGLRLAREVR